MVILSLMGLSTIGWARPPPEPPSVYYATSYSISWPSQLINGDLDSIKHYNDGDTMKIKAGIGLPFPPEYVIHVYFEFPDVVADTVSFGFTDNFIYDTTQILVYYTDGTYDFCPNGLGSDGYYVLDLDPGKMIDYIRLNFVAHPLWWCSLYLYIDALYATRYY